MRDMELVVWGSHPAYANGTPIRLTGGTVAHCRREIAFRKIDDRWSLAVLRPGVRPVALRAQVTR
jgi:hypothetical protein